MSLLSMPFSGRTSGSSTGGFSWNWTGPPNASTLSRAAASAPSFPIAANSFRLTIDDCHMSYGGGCSKFSRRLKFWMIQNLYLRKPNRKHEPQKEFKSLQIQDEGHSKKHLEATVSHEECVPPTGALGIGLPSGVEHPLWELLSLVLLVNWQGERFFQHCLHCTTVAFFQRQNCGDKMNDFLRRTYYLDGGYDNQEGMSKLHSQMELIEGESGANRIFYLSVPQEALLDVAISLAENAQSKKGWNRIIIEKPFGFDPQSSYQLTQSLLSKFQEEQLYRIDHLLGRNIIENLTVLRFSNLVFQPLWNRTYVSNIQVTISEDLGVQMQGRYYDEYGIIRDIVHSHILQTIALLAMEPPISLDGEDIRNEKVKVLRSIRKLELGDVVLGQYKGGGPGGKVDTHFGSLTPTYFAAALFIDNARWDGVPFLIKAGMGLIKHRVEIRIQFRHVPGNLYRHHIGHNIDLATNELILRDAPDEAILVRVNNKVPGLSLHLDASELNLLYKDKYNNEVPDSYEHLLLDVIDGDSHLFMRSDELAAAWNILSPVLREIDKKNMAPELYELGGRGPVGAYYLWAKHGVPWIDD
ncbi:inactive glucose-6-phosphate 1-dehydrogenase 4, chloroplastic isoform X2 [Diospyros lotus]|uniref:inactive glucose-6-phosphate 1-dehydrogenase 4, chloroplastic isoform X2 n=1 Tax=Diospyros lotus TaxID=55363 RepID=UPI00225055CB|nr:inactive glucose-6-phosphate 1-dehydrogenase 4, chloroplastic isoform X2 [Diospyros lotus]